MPQCPPCPTSGGSGQGRGPAAQRHPCGGPSDVVLPSWGGEALAADREPRQRRGGRIAGVGTAALLGAGAPGKGSAARVARRGGATPGPGRAAQDGGRGDWRPPGRNAPTGAPTEAPAVRRPPEQSGQAGACARPGRAAQGGGRSPRAGPPAGPIQATCPTQPKYLPVPPQRPRASRLTLPPGLPRGSELSYRSRPK